MTDMKALSVRQPYAWLIVSGNKDIENRTWSTRHRGILIIHASQTVNNEALTYFRKEFHKAGFEFPQELPTGALVGVVTLTDCVTSHASDWFNGPIGWVLRNAGEFETPIPTKGKLGLFNVPDIDLEWD